MKKASIVIPTYKRELSELERISLAQAVKIFEGYDKFFTLPCSLKISYAVEDIKEIKFEDDCFQSIQTYNDLLMNEEFYEKFTEYEYILIYQLDAFVFEDKLEYFCSLGYDYIGAPWLSGQYYMWNHKIYTLHVGNGGLSLRNVKKCMELIRQKRRLFPQNMNEDVFFSLGRLGDFKVAPMDTALEFAVEREVKRCFEAGGYKLPFGCHAWEKYDLKFWKRHIEDHGYKIDAKYLPNGEKDLASAEEYDRERETTFFLERIYQKDDLEKFLNKQKKKIYIWGAGGKGRFWGILLNEIDADIEGYLDNNPELAGTYIERYKVLPMEEFEKNGEDAYIIIAVDRYGNEIAERLEKMGYQYQNDYIFYIDIFRLLAEKQGLDGD